MKATAETKYYTNKSNANRAGVKQFGKDKFLVEETKQGFKVVELAKDSSVAKHLEAQQKAADKVANKHIMEPVAKAQPTAKAKKAAEQVEEKVDAPKTIGGIEVTRESTVVRPCKQVWHIADSMPGAKRKAVLEACVNAGIAYYTARTQYQQWLECQKEMAAARPAKTTK
jgi:hypothetical protein